jgi:hypothetical protein
MLFFITASRSKITRLIRNFALTLVLPIAFLNPARAQVMKTIPGHIPRGMAGIKALARLPETNRLHLVVGLPFRNPDDLTNLLEELQHPASTNYHRWLSAEEFDQRFGPTDDDYQKVVSFARSHGLNIASSPSNRVVMDLEAPVANIENAFHVHLHLYPHPTENRDFYAPDADPTVDADVPILHVSGLDNFTSVHRIGGPLKITPLDTNGIVAYATGSGPSGNFIGNDFRAAFAPGVTNTGLGQYIAVVDVGGPYYTRDVYEYETNAGLSTNTVVTNILLSGSTGIPVGNTANEGEQVLDIDMSMSMAPDATILNYEGNADDVFPQIAIDNKAKQITLSYGFGIDPTIVQSFQRFLAQGQAFSQASGDGGADLDGGTGLTGMPYATIVGGISLATTSRGGPFSTTTPAWGGSGGGISGYGSPTWQQGVNMAFNQGSTIFRDYPDVAMPADNIFTVYENGTIIGGTGGTSAASPLWAGFMALVNQQAAAAGQTSVGFPNPAIYAIGKSSSYSKCFYDIATGNTENSQNPGRYTAISGYDLCTGWGSPTGSNTINALVGTGTNDFTFYVLPDALNIVRGGTEASIVTLTRMNAFNGAVTFSVSGLAPGITATFSPATTTNSSLLTFSNGSTAAAGASLVSVTGTSGALTHTVSFILTNAAPIPGATAASLASFYNRSGIWSDGRAFSGGLDGGGYSYSANLLSPSPSWNGLVFNLGPANAPDVVSCSGQTIPLPAGNFTSLQLLAAGVEGNQTSQTFTVTYTDISTATFTQNLSDWANPQSYANESKVVSMAYRDTSGSEDTYTPVNVYGYGFALNQTKMAKSLTLPNNNNVIVLGVVMANEPVATPLSSYFNRAGMYSDGTTFTNPPTGGIDGSGFAYSSSLLTGSQMWSNTLFDFGPANVTNVISCAGQTIALPAGNYSALRMLATGVQGAQPSEAFSVIYSDGSSSSFTQTLSDWYTPGNYTGESKAVTMGHRNGSDGIPDNRTFYLYGYSFKLNSAKITQSFKLPTAGNVIITAVSLVPNWAPAFTANPFTEPSAAAGQPYSASIATNATDLNGDSLTFSLLSGPAWLTVSSAGLLSGTPYSAQDGLNTFVVSVADPGGMTNTATLNINVTPAPAIVSSFTNTGTNLVLNFTGGISPYQLQVSTNLSETNWVNVGSPTNANSFSITPSEPAAFYRIVGQ